MHRTAFVLVLLIAAAGPSGAGAQDLPATRGPAAAPAGPPPLSYRAAPGVAAPRGRLATRRQGAQPPPPGYPSPAICPPPPQPTPHPPGLPSNVLPSRPFPRVWQETLDGFTARGAFPGAVVIVKSPEWGVRVGTTGVADLVSKVPPAPDMQFRIGSVTKFFMAQTILQLEQEGRLRLTDPVLTYLGGDPIVAGIPHIDQVTIGMLMQMTSGLAEYLAAPSIGFSPQVSPGKSFAPDDLMAVLSTAGSGTPLPPFFAPQQTYPNPYWVAVYGGRPAVPAEYPYFTYTNANYILLGMIAEKVSGLPPERLFKAYIFDRLGMADTVLATDMTLPEMHGYTKYGAIPYPVQVYDQWCDVTATNPSYAWTAGAIVSTPWDLLRFEEAAFESTLLLDQGTKAKWLRFVSADIELGWEPMDYGVGGLMQAERAYGAARGHGGAFPGFKTMVYYFFDQKTSFILATNSWDEHQDVAVLDAIMPLVTAAVTTPDPADHSDGVGDGGPQTLTLTWQAGVVYGSTYRVYWAEDADAVERATPEAHDGVGFETVAGTSVAFTVQPDTTYYWRVDTVAPGQPLPLVNGPLWTFATR